MVLNALVPFATRLSDDGLVHVRVWTGRDGPVALVAELDWALLVADRGDAYFGPGIFTYPGYALGAARDACRAAGMEPVRTVVRIPDPPGERFALVDDPEDPQGWPDVPATDLPAVLGGAEPEGPPPGAYVQRVVEHWVRTGSLPG
jgi:hypothetical protein